MSKIKHIGSDLLKEEGITFGSQFKYSVYDWDDTYDDYHDDYLYGWSRKHDYPEYTYYDSVGGWCSPHLEMEERRDRIINEIFSEIDNSNKIENFWPKIK